MVFNEANIINPYGIIPDSEGKYLYVSHFYGISAVNTSTWTASLLTGSIHPPPPSLPPQDGTLTQANYGSELNLQICWLSSKISNPNNYH